MLCSPGGGRREAIRRAPNSAHASVSRAAQVPETLPDEILAKMHAPPKGDAPLIDVHTLADYDGFVFAFPTRFGTPAGQFKAFIDATGQLWQKGALVGKPYTCLTSSASLGAQETTILAAVINFVSCWQQQGRWQRHLRKHLLWSPLLLGQALAVFGVRGRCARSDDGRSALAWCAACVRCCCRCRVGEPRHGVRAQRLHCARHAV